MCMHTHVHMCAHPHKQKEHVIEKLSISLTIFPSVVILSWLKVLGRLVAGRSKESSKLFVEWHQ